MVLCFSQYKGCLPPHSCFFIPPTGILYLYYVWFFTYFHILYGYVRIYPFHPFCAQCQGPFFLVYFNTFHPKRKVWKFQWIIGSWILKVSLNRFEWENILNGCWLILICFFFCLYFHFCFSLLIFLWKKIFKFENWIFDFWSKSHIFIVLNCFHAKF